MADRRAAWVVLALVGALPASAAAQTSLTIYQDGRVLERRVLPIAVPAGVSVHRLPVGQIEIGSLFAVDSGVVITGAVYDAAMDEANVLRRAVGRTLAFWTGIRPTGERDSVRVVVVGVDPERYGLPDGRITFQRPGIPLFPPDLVLTAPSAVATVRSDRARPSLAIGYFSGGASWRAEYAVTLHRGVARIVGHAAIEAGLLQADSAEVQLFAGPAGRPAARRVADEAIAMRAAAAPGEAAGEEQLGESRLYTLPGRLDFTPGLVTTALLFDPAAAPVERQYVVRGQLPFYGPLQQLGDEATQPVQVVYTVQRSARSGFGNVPVPAGSARVYQRDAAGRIQLIGEAGVRASAPGQSISLETGSAFDLTAKRVQTEYTTRRDSTRTLAFASYRVTLANAKDSVVTIDVLEQRAGEWSVLSSSVPAERLSSTSTRFRVRVPARGEATLTYRVRVIW